MEQKALPYVILFSTALFFIITILVFILVFYYQKKKHQFLLRQKEQKQKFEETLTKTQVEIHEHALQNIAWELHDNIGQMLSVARLQLNRMAQKAKDNEKITEISQLIGNSLEEIRSISKTLNLDIINDIGLIKSIQLEIDRFNRLNFIDSKLEVKGETYKISNKAQIILFRIVQEFFSNTIKHAQATELYVKLDYTPKYLSIFVKDNGTGFKIEKVQKGSGLINMQSRAAIIDTQMNLTSDQEGTTLRLTYPNKTFKE